jgi:hypothetical protein
MPDSFSTEARKKNSARSRAFPLRPRGVPGGEVERLALAHVLGGPRFGGIFEDLRPVQVRALVVGHPAGVVKQRGAGVGVSAVELAQSGLVVEVAAESLEEHHVEPAVLDVVQPARGQIVRRVDAAAYQLVRLGKEGRIPAEAVPVERVE